MASLRKGLDLRKGCVISLVGAGGKTSLMYRLARELSTAGDTVLTTTTTKIFKPSTDQSFGVIISESVNDILDRAKNLLKKQRHITAGADWAAEKNKLIGFSPEFIKRLWMAELFQWIIVEADGAAGRPIKVPAAHEPVIPDCTRCLVGLVGLNGVGKPLNEQLVFRHEKFGEITGLIPGAYVSEEAIVNVLMHKNGIFKGTPPEVVRIAFLNQADTAQNLAAGQRIVKILSKRKYTGLKRVVIGQVAFDPPVLETYCLRHQGD
jgi:probable selenium-dependent hydroxylase accessory protein YqeC